MSRVYAIFLTTVAIAFPVWAEGPAQQSAQTSTTQLLSFAPGGTIRWDNSYGDLYIEGWDQAQVEITVIKSTHYYEPAGKEQATQGLDTVRVATDRKSDTELAISTTLPRRKDWAPPLRDTKRNGVTMEYRVRVPWDSRLVIDHHGGYVLVGNVTGDIDVSNRSGEIMLMLPAKGSYSIDAKSRMGHIASDFAGTAWNRYVVGQRFSGTGPSPAHRIHLRTGFGGITILAIPPEAEALSIAQPE
jgi:hypothetical protein